MTTDTKQAGRLASLDALRGFDMFFITGGATLIAAVAKLFGDRGGWLAEQMRHVPWEGLAHHDTIFPLFLFLAGVSWPFSYASQVAKGVSTGRIYLKIVRRAAILFAFGLSLGGIFQFLPNFRIPSVLGFIGLSWAVAAVFFMNVKGVRARVAAVGALLIGYWALLSFTVAPDAPAGAGSYEQAGNIVSWLDRTLMTNHIYVKGVYDPESLFSLPGGVAMALLGMLAGAWLRRTDVSAGRKAAGLAGGALGLLALDALFIWVLGDRIVKALWTSSFVLSAATYSCAMLALFYWLVDVKGWRGWTLYFRVIGLNSITIYMAQNILGFRQARDYFFSGLVEAVPQAWSPVVSSVGYLAVVWLFLYILYRNKVFLKV